MAASSSMLAASTVRHLPAIVSVPFACDTQRWPAAELQLDTSTRVPALLLAPGSFRQRPATPDSTGAPGSTQPLAEPQVHSTACLPAVALPRMARHRPVSEFRR